MKTNNKYVELIFSPSLFTIIMTAAMLILLNGVFLAPSVVQGEVFEPYNSYNYGLPVTSYGTVYTYWTQASVTWGSPIPVCTSTRGFQGSDSDPLVCDSISYGTVTGTGRGGELDPWVRVSIIPAYTPPPTPPPPPPPPPPPSTPNSGQNTGGASQPPSSPNNNNNNNGGAGQPSGNAGGNGTGGGAGAGGGNNGGGNILPATLSIDAIPRMVQFGGSATIEWTTTNVDTCSVEGPNLVASLTSGSQVVDNITQQSEYTLTCLGLDGLEYRDSANIFVAPAWQEF